MLQNGTELMKKKMWLSVRKTTVLSLMSIILGHFMIYTYLLLNYFFIKPLFTQVSPNEVTNFSFSREPWPRQQRNMFKTAYTQTMI